jgi:hypothetical protein
MADCAITWKQRPVDFVSACSPTAAYRSHVALVRGSPKDDAEAISQPAIHMVPVMGAQALLGDMTSKSLCLPASSFSCPSIWL